ncbi:hypothetical protein GJ744_006246 [Endocarpon pusillum]|uniref:Histone-lysine N-methyltransferase ASH1L n=1 Tax=Endocarpon pusillum TaxID=364733 RepID=A0A8H7ANH5_9EURO|nr:hypothetical protein GJ744_006246 [Endocarpon pusillum]
MHSPWPEPSRPSTASSETLPADDDPDTIIVDCAGHQPQLPTPAESTTDASSDSSHDIYIQQIPQSKPRRVNPKSGARQQSRDDIVKTTLSEKGRSVSGETLVTNASQSSLLRSGIAALDLPWSVTSLVQHHETMDAESWSQNGGSSASNVEEDHLRAEKAAAKRAKMEENAKRWNARKKAAEEKATRRSSRGSMLEKAGEALSGLTASVLGKPPKKAVGICRDRQEDIKRRASLRPRSMIDPLILTTPALEGPQAKIRRLSDGDLDNQSRTAEALILPKKPPPVRREKGWLSSGLYAGQTRDFDGAPSESKNKRKHDDMAPVRENRTLPLPMFAGERLMQQGRDFKLPYDVFSPLPPGQPRPDEWRKTNKNVFVGDAAQVWRHSKPREHSTCMCTQETGCDENCMNRFMFYECDDGNCNLAECSNRSFQSLAQRSKKGGKYNVGVEVIQTRDRGFGVRSNRTFEPNQIIVEYTGEIITQDECDKRMRTLYKNNECYYLMLFDQNMIIDATRGSIARFVNHSCEPNCRMEKWTVGGKPRMALFAGDKGIMTGDELTYDYNFDPFSQKNVQECRCGSSKCRGVLGPKAKEERKPKPEKELGPSAASRLAGAKRKIADILDEGTDRWNKRPKIGVPASAAAALKRITTTKPRSRSPARTPVHSSTQPSPSKPALRAASLSTRGVTTRRPSILKRIVDGATQKPTTRRTASHSSSSEALLGGQIERPLTRAESVKAKAASIRKNAVSIVRGAT